MKPVKRGFLPLLMGMLLLLLTACAASEPEEDVLVYAALNPLAKDTARAIERFNNVHPDIQIEVHDYSDEGGPERLMTELVLGQVPDIMEMQRLGCTRDIVAAAEPPESLANPFDPTLVEALWYTGPFDADMSDMFWMPYRQLVKKGYLEDLWPYIDNDPRFGRQRVLEAPLKAAEVDGGLYMIPRFVSVNTLAGAQSVVGNRYGWTLAELMEAYDAMPEGSTVLRYDTTRSEVLFKLLAPLLDQFIDWETGECSFDSQGFRDMLGFLSLFPDHIDTWLTSVQIDEENAWRKLDGLQMLEPVSLAWLCDFKLDDTKFGKPAAHVGYPTVDGGSGSSFVFHGATLAMSATCKNKEAAWDYICRSLHAESKSFTWMETAHSKCWIKIPLNRIAYRVSCMADMELHQRYFTTAPGMPWSQTPLATREDWDRFDALINHTTQLYWPNDAVSESVWDAIAPYFAGDKTMDEAIDMVQRRVKLYVNENI